MICDSSTVFHYTSEAGLKGILDKDKITFHFTIADSVNDINEGKDIIKHVITAITELKKEGKLKEAEYNDIKSNLSFPFTPYIFNFTNTDEEKKLDYGCMPSDPYIICFSKQKDSLPMWNYYCTRGNLGYALEIDIKKLQLLLFKKTQDCKVDINVDPVEYSTENKVAYVKEHIDQCINHNVFEKNYMDYIYSQLKFLINQKRYLYKDSAFMYEDEVRAVISVPKGNQDFLSEHLQFKTRNGYFIPYLEITINEDFRDIVKSIRIGPLTNYELAERNLKMYLNHIGYTELAQNIVPSDIQIRF